MQEDWGDEGGGEGEDDEESEPVPSFPELTQQISSAIESLEGAVLPKLNWSSPRVRCVCVCVRERKGGLTFHTIPRMLLGYLLGTPCGALVLQKSFYY